MTFYALGLTVLLGGALGIALGDDRASDPTVGVRTDKRASRGETRDGTSTSGLPAQPFGATAPSATLAPSVTPAALPTTTVKATPPKPAPPAPGCATYSGNRRIACNMLPSFGFSTSQMPPLDKLWQRESGWRHTASNPSSGAYGIPQALPGSKMATAGSDWRTNPATQIKWGLGYIKQRYGSPAGAWRHSQSTGWY